MYICIYIKSHEVEVKHYGSMKECKEWAKGYGYTIKQRKFIDFHHYDEKKKINLYIQDISDNVNDLKSILSLESK